MAYSNYIAIECPVSQAEAGDNSEFRIAHQPRKAQTLQLQTMNGGGNRSESRRGVQLSVQKHSVPLKSQRFELFSTEISSKRSTAGDSTVMSVAMRVIQLCSHGVCGSSEWPSRVIGGD